MEGVEVRKERITDELTVAREELESGRMGEGDKRELIARLLDQCENFYAEKKSAGNAERDFVQLFAPSWCSSLESAFLWFTGFRPTSLFPIVFASVHDLSRDQQTRLHRLKREILMEEKALGEKQAEIQAVTMASEPIITMIKEISRRPNSVKVADGEFFVIRDGMEAMVLEAVKLRTKTTTKLVEVLDSEQSITFLLAVITFQRKLKAHGMKRDASLQVRKEVEYV